jgi:hypothetical protein
VNEWCKDKNISVDNCKDAFQIITFQEMLFIISRRWMGVVRKVDDRGFFISRKSVG